MSRPAHLPPRSSFQRRSVARPAQDHISLTASKNFELHHGHHKSISEGSILEEQPAWFNDLLNDSHSISVGISHRRAASDSVTFVDGLVHLSGLDQLNETETLDGCEQENRLESAGMYGPNSPRAKGKITFAENVIVSALSEYVSSNQLHHLNSSISGSGTAQWELAGEDGASAGDSNLETKPKRHPGQRSRVRKLQYIAELERTVEILQNLESDLAARVGSLLQQRIALSIENTQLKQQMLKLQQEKFIADGEYQSLKKEAERLKTRLLYRNKMRSRSSYDADLASSGSTWQMLDMRKLDLN